MSIKKKQSAKEYFKSLSDNDKYYFMAGSCKLKRFWKAGEVMEGYYFPGNDKIEAGYVCADLADIDYSIFSTK